MFRKYQLAAWLSTQNSYSHFTKVTRKCFGRIVEPCIIANVLASSVLDCVFEPRSGQTTL